MKLTKIVLPLLALSLSAASAQTVRVYQTPSVSNLEVGVTGGTYGGLGLQGFVGARNVVGPLGVRLSGSYGSNSGGFNEDVAMPLLGTIAQQKASGLVTGTSSKNTTLGLDATYELGRIANRTEATVYGGLRYGNFKSSLSYGNQTTDYTSSRFGLGAGVEAGYAINRNLSLIGQVGADYYMGGSITSNDGKGNTDTQSADKVAYVNQPGTVLKAGVGLKYRF